MLTFKTCTASLLACSIMMMCCNAARTEAPATAAAVPTVRLALLGDPHVSNDPALAQHLAHFATVIDQVNAAKVDAVLIAGDLTQSGDADAERSFKTLITRFHAPCWYVPGNHDVGQRSIASAKCSVSDARLTQFQTLVGPIRFATDILPHVHLIGIASSLFGTGLPQEKEQWDFLEKQLHANQEGVTLLLAHYPLYAGSPEEPNGYFNLDPASRKRLGDLLHDAANVLMLSAHLHRPIQHEWKNVKDIGAPAISFGRPRATQKVGWTLITLDSNSPPTVELHYLHFDAPPASQPSHAAVNPGSNTPAALSQKNR